MNCLSAPASQLRQAQSWSSIVRGAANGSEAADEAVEESLHCSVSPSLRKPSAPCLGYRPSTLQFLSPASLDMSLAAPLDTEVQRCKVRVDAGESRFDERQFRLEREGSYARQGLSDVSHGSFLDLRVVCGRFQLFIPAGINVLKRIERRQGVATAFSTYLEYELTLIQAVHFKCGERVGDSAAAIRRQIFESPLPQAQVVQDSQHVITDCHVHC